MNHRSHEGRKDPRLRHLSDIRSANWSEQEIRDVLRDVAEADSLATRAPFVQQSETLDPVRLKLGSKRNQPTFIAVGMCGYFTERDGRGRPHGREEHRQREEQEE